MTDPAIDPANNGQAEQAALADAALAAHPGASVPVTEPVFAAPTSTADERPELVVGAAFAGGLLAALLLKRLAR